jgi:hypothetical protein
MYHYCPGCRAVNVTKAKQEALFADELALLQPTPGYCACSRNPCCKSESAPGGRARRAGGLCGECPYSGTIRWGGQAHGAGRDRDHGHCVADHVEELDRVPFFGCAGHEVSLHNRANIAGAEAALDYIAGQNHVAVWLERHLSYLGYIVLNRGTSLPVSICQIEQKRTVLPLGVVIGPSIS